MSGFMRMACEEAERGIATGEGGPFGAVVVKDGQVISAAHNMVISWNDSTAHAEIVAIRRAEQALEKPDLSGCEMYATSYPCPMCLAAIMWARIGKVYYCFRPEDAARVGFDDQAFYLAFESRDYARFVGMQAVSEPACVGLLEQWLASETRRLY